MSTLTKFKTRSKTPLRAGRLLKVKMKRRWSGPRSLDRIRGCRWPVRTAVELVAVGKLSLLTRWDLNLGLRCCAQVATPRKQQMTNSPPLQRLLLPLLLIVDILGMHSTLCYPSLLHVLLSPSLLSPLRLPLHRGRAALRMLLPPPPCWHPLRYVLFCCSPLIFTFTLLSFSAAWLTFSFSVVTSQVVPSASLLVPSCSLFSTSDSSVMRSARGTKFYNNA